MRKTLTIDGKDLEFEANAGTPILYKRAFHDDLLNLFKETEDAEAIDKIIKLAYIMHIQTKGTTTEVLKEATEEKFVEWICSFSSDAFINEDSKELLKELVLLWIGQQKTTSKEKN